MRQYKVIKNIILYFTVTFITVKLLMPAADIRISGARSRMDMLPDYFEAAATSKNWKIALQLKLRNFCMRPARRIGDMGRASSVPYISRRHRRPRIYNKVYFIVNTGCGIVICYVHEDFYLLKYFWINNLPYHHILRIYYLYISYYLT